MQGACSVSGTIELSMAFVMGSYTSQCDFSGKTIIMRCNGKTLDAGQEKRFFSGSGSGSSLQVHGCVLMRGKASVSVVLGVALRASC